MWSPVVHGRGHCPYPIFRRDAQRRVRSILLIAAFNQIPCFECRGQLFVADPVLRGNLTGIAFPHRGARDNLVTALGRFTLADHDRNETRYAAVTVRLRIDVLAVCR